MRRGRARVHAGEPFAEKFPRLVAELQEQFAESNRLQQAIQQHLALIGPKERE